MSNDNTRRITKEQLKEIISEEMENQSALIDAINSLSGKIEDLDISIDYLAGAVTDQDPFAIGYSQATSGRLAKPKSKTVTGMDEIKEMIVDELNDIVDENIIPPELRASLKDTFTKVPGAEGSLSGGKISNMPRAKAAWSDLGKQIDTSKPEQIKQFHKDARLQIDLQKYMDNIEYAQKGERLGSIIYSLRDAIALSLPPASRRAHFKGDKRNRPPQFTRK